MPTLNADVPVWDCWLRQEFLYDGELSDGTCQRVTVFGVSSLQGRALGFHVMVHATGAVIWRLPIHALCARLEADALELEQCQLWDCFSYELSVTEFGHLDGRRCKVWLRGGVEAEGRYRFTVDWYGSAYAENAGDSGHKCAHVIELDDGNYVAQPNNRVLWADPAVIEKPFEKRPDYRTNTREWRVEGTSRWATTEGMFYDVEELHEEQVDEDMAEAVDDAIWTECDHAHKTLSVAGVLSCLTCGEVLPT